MLHMPHLKEQLATKTETTKAAGINNNGYIKHILVLSLNTHTYRKITEISCLVLGIIF